MGHRHFKSGAAGEEESAPASDQRSTPANATAAAQDRSDNVVSVDQVIARVGPIPITGRYVRSSTRLLENDYQIDTKVVGSGMSGPVKLATGKDGRQYAVKSFKKRGLSSSKRNDLKNEVEIYLSLDHPHVARLEMVYETSEELHLVMEFMEGGELYDRLSKRKRYTEEAAAETTHQMLLAVAYLHGHQIAHRDLKLENFLYEAKDTNHLKLIDFGFAKFWDHSTKMSQACGSVHYVAPEVLSHSYTEKADMWSIGVIVYMLLTGSPPFHGSDSEVLKKIKAGKPHLSSRFLKLSEQAKGFVQSLLVFDPTTRLSAEAAHEHPWVKSREQMGETVIDITILKSLQNYAHASSFRRAVLSMMAWSLNSEDRIQLREQFLLMDKDKKGTITHTQMKLLLEENFHIDSAEAETLFKSLDTDNDNVIAYSEFLAAALQGRVKVHEDVLRKTFARFDRDDCGVISADDLREVFRGSFEGADVEELINEADTSGDGKIDYDEFLAYFHLPTQEEQEELVAEASDMPLKRTRKHHHTEKLGIVIDRLITEAVSNPHASCLSPGQGASPVSPMRKRRESKALTMPASLSHLLATYA